jgi:hypothetical protein
MATKTMLTGVRVARTPIFIPAKDGNTKHNHLIATVLDNSPMPNGEEATVEVSCHFWGKGAAIAANYLLTGSRINIEGSLQSFARDTGQLTSAGKRILERTLSLKVYRMELLNDSRKYRSEVFDKCILNLKAQGRLPQEVHLTLDDVEPKKSTMVDFNPQVAAETGRYVNARVWSKDRGWWKADEPTPATTDKDEMIRNLEKQLEMIKGTSKQEAASNVSIF